MAQGFLQIALFCAILVASVPLLGGYMARVFTAPAAAAGARTSRARTGRPTRGAARLLRRCSALLLFVDPAHAGDPPVQPGGFQLRDLGPVVQHHLVVRDEHQLAVLRRRDDALVLQPDGRPGGPELRLGRCRHRRRRRADPRHRRAREATGRSATSGRPRPGPSSTSCSRSRSSRGRAGLPGRHPDARRQRSAGSPAARSPRRRRSSSSAPTAAASSTSTRPTRSRTRRRSRTSSRCS